MPLILGEGRKVLGLHQFCLRGVHQESAGAGEERGVCPAEVLVVVHP